VAFFNGAGEGGHDEVLGADHLNDLLVRDDPHRLEDDRYRDVLKGAKSQAFGGRHRTEVAITLHTQPALVLITAPDFSDVVM